LNFTDFIATGGEPRVGALGGENGPLWSVCVFKPAFVVLSRNFICSNFTTAAQMRPRKNKSTYIRTQHSLTQWHAGAGRLGLAWPGPARPSQQLLTASSSPVRKLSFPAAHSHRNRKTRQS